MLRGRAHFSGALTGTDATFSGRIRGGAGTAALPTFSFGSDTNTGIYNSGSNDNLLFSIGGVQRAFLSATQLNVAANIVGVAGTFSGAVSGTTGSFSGALTIGSYTLPTADGTNGYVLKTNGSGTVAWAAESGGGGGGGTVTSIGIDPGTGLDVSNSPITSSGDITVSLDFTEFADLTTDIADTDEVIFIQVGSGGGQRRKAFGELKLSKFDNDSGWTDSTVTSVTTPANSGLTVANTTTTPSITLDFFQFTDFTADIIGAYEIVFLETGSGGGQRRKAFSELKLSKFNNDSGWTNNTGTITNVTAGTTLSGGGSSGSVTINHASHTGEVTGSGSLTIAANVVDEANLKVSNAPTNGHVLTARSGNTGGMTWEAPSGGGGGMTDWVGQDGDGTNVTIGDGKYVKFKEGTGMDINWTDTSSGTSGDPYDLTFYVSTGVCMQIYTTYNSTTSSASSRKFHFDSEGSVYALSDYGDGIKFSSYSSSDYRLKKNISTFNSEAWTKVKSVNLRKFDFDENSMDAANAVDKNVVKPTTLTDKIGWIAHELSEAGIEGAVTGTKDEVDADGNAVYQKVDPIKLIPVMWGALNEAITKIETLETKVQTLENN